MTDAVKYQTLEKFMGISNVSDATRLVPLIINREYVYPLQTASDVDIDDTYRISMRPGYDDVLSGTDIHSIWSDKYEAICLYVDGTVLYRLDENYTAWPMRTGLTKGARMSYAAFNDRYYFTNGYEIGYIKNRVACTITDPLKDFKRVLPAGQHIEVYKTHLLVSRNNVLYIGDPLCDHYDTRKGYRQFVGKISMVRAVDTGVFVSDDSVWFIKGDSPDEFVRDEAYPSRAIPFSDVSINGAYLGAEIDGNVAIWTSENGICLGDNSGKVANLTEERYSLSGRGRGAAFIRETNNKRHYINSLY